MMLDKLDDIRANLIRSGYLVGCEQYGVCSHAMSYLGLPYLRTEEFASDTIDCSTLTSQSYWEGAVIGIPFIAEGQRQAVSGLSIETIAGAEPSDILIRYPSVEHSPDKKFNHVGIFLGHDTQGQGWLIEARGGKGVILTKMDDFPPLGGIKRFVVSKRKIFDSENAKAALRLARRVPKLGRLGARQYLSSSTERNPHKGIDIYLEPDTNIYAPLSGMLRLYRCENEKASGIEIVSDSNPNLIVRLVHVKTHLSSTVVATGDHIGILEVPESTNIAYIKNLSTRATHLHFEVEYPESTFLQLQSYTRLAGRYYFNPLYLAKLDILRVPVQG